LRRELSGLHARNLVVVSLFLSLLLGGPLSLQLCFGLVLLVDAPLAGAATAQQVRAERQAGNQEGESEDRKSDDPSLHEQTLDTEHHLLIGVPARFACRILDCKSITCCKLQLIVVRTSFSCRAPDDLSGVNVPPDKCNQSVGHHEEQQHVQRLHNLSRTDKGKQAPAACTHNTDDSELIRNIDTASIDIIPITTQRSFRVWTSVGNRRV